MGAIQQLFLAASASLDPDAEAFLTAAGISDPTIESAINTLVLDLKADSIWASMTALFPFVGGTSSTCSYNLADPALHQITWNGSVTFDANGVTGDGSTGYGEIDDLSGPDTTPDDLAFGVYLRTNSNGAFIELGSNQASIFARLGDTAYFDNLFNGGAGRTSTANTDSRGLFVSSRTASNVHKGYRNGSQIGSTCTGAQGDLSTLAQYDFFVCANATGVATPGTLSDRNVALAFISSGLDDTDTANFYTAVQAFQTALSRNV